MSTDTKEMSEQLSLPSHWRLVQGTLASLEHEEDSESFVVFEKQFPTSTLLSKSGSQNDTTHSIEAQTTSVASVASAADAKEKADVKEKADAKEKKESGEQAIELVRIVLSRSQNWEGQGSQSVAKNRLALFLLFGNPSIKREPGAALITDPTPRHKMLENFEKNIRYHFSSVRGMQASLSTTKLDIINPVGSILTTQRLGWFTETQRDYKLKALFQIFQENNFLNEDEARYFQKICGYQKPSSEEENCKNKIVTLLAKTEITEKDLDTVVNYAKDAHKSSLKHSFNHAYKDDSGFVYVHEESDIAYELGIKLEPISTVHAIKAFQIIANYQVNPTSKPKRVSISSPFKAAATEKLAYIQMGLCGDNNLSELDKKKLRQETLQTLIGMLDPSIRASENGREFEWTSISYDSAEKAGKLILNLLERHCGFQWSTGPFGNISLGMRDNDTFLFFSRVMISMANELFKHNDANTNTNANGNAEENLSQLITSSSQTVKPLIYSTLPTSSVSVTHSTPVADHEITSLDSDDETEDATANVARKLSFSSP